MTPEVEEAATAVLIAHQRKDVRSCLCGWAELGKSHSRHQMMMLKGAGLLAVRQTGSSAERVAREFHAAYERLAPEHGYETREASAKPWENVPDNNRNLMVATVQDLLDRGVITTGG